MSRRPSRDVVSIYSTRSLESAKLESSETVEVGATKPTRRQSKPRSSAAQVICIRIFNLTLFNFLTYFAVGKPVGTMQWVQEMEKVAHGC